MPNPPSDPGDEALAAAAKRGEVRALETLLDRHQAKVLRVLRLMGVPGQDREDVAQEVLIRVFRHLAGFRSGYSFQGWLYRVTVNSAHDYRTRRARVARGEAPWSPAAEDAVDPGPPPSASTSEGDLRRALEAALDRLSDRERAVFVLREMEGLEAAAVARALGISTITVRRHLGLARRRLRRVLSGPPVKKKPRIVERTVEEGGSSQ